MAFAPDGNWLYYNDVDSAGKQSLLRVATSGSQAERVGDFPHGLPGELEISPDGSKIVLGMNDISPYIGELWSLENFVPPAPKK